MAVRSIGRRASNDFSETSRPLVSIVLKSARSFGLAGGSRLDFDVDE